MAPVACDEIVDFARVVAFTYDRGPCDENHGSVKRMRALSEEQLKDLHRRVMDLREKHPDTEFTRYSDPPIPASVGDLEALRVTFRGPTDDVNILLAKCDVSEGIYLEFRSGSVDMIEIFWYDPTEDNPFAHSSEVLLSART